MSTPYIGQITLFGGTFAPAGWALCNGQLLNIGQNSALFSILGTVYGGNGQTTFALPDLRGRVPMHPGTGAGLSSRVLGDAGGLEDVTLTASQMPSHTHTLRAKDSTGDASNPANHVLALVEDQNRNGLNIYSTSAPDADMDSDSIQAAGGGNAHTNIQPYLVVNYIIALSGIFPSP